MRNAVRGVIALDRNPAHLFAPAAVHVERRGDDSLILKSPQPLLPISRCIGDWLLFWANRSPDRPFLCERGRNGVWRKVTYAQTLHAVRSIASWLLRREPERRRPIVILSDNSVEHGWLALAAMHVGLPIVPISPAYSLVSEDFGKLKSIIGALDPAVVYASSEKQFGAALSCISALHEADVVVAADEAVQPGRISFAELLECSADDAVDAAFATLGPDTIAKLLFTSGSTGSPKGVINTQRMLCANQQQIAQVWPFTSETPPVIVDWLPWNHTFGGNYDFNLTLRAGGTLYIDEGRPTSQGFARTIANLREVPSTIHFNVPRGYDMLVAALSRDEELRQKFFSRLQIIFYAAAALPQHLWEALGALALETTGQSIPLVSAWGSTETSPLATSCHFPAPRAGVIGLPVPGTELKLVKSGPKLEARIRGPQVTPGYWKDAVLTARSFDDEGFYRIGDALRFVDEARPELGLYFDGRVSEDFKLMTGTWVSTGALRIKALATLSPWIQDIVVAGHDREEVGFLLFPNFSECQRIRGGAAGTQESIVRDPQVRSRIAEGLAVLKLQATGSSTFAARAILMIEAPSIDAGEITDKGYINQRVVLSRRAILVQQLFSRADSTEIIRPAPEVTGTNGE